MIIRKATEKDAYKISYLIRRVTEFNPNGYTHEQLETWVKFNSPSKIKSQFLERTIFCAFEHQKLIGTIAIQKDTIHGFYVSYSQRNKGIGSKLFDHIEKYAVKQNIRILKLTATPSALAFYTKKGFKKIDKKIVTINAVDYQEFSMEKIIKK